MAFLGVIFLTAADRVFMSTDVWDLQKYSKYIIYNIQITSMSIS